ncbi:MAG: hypothetical protein ACFCD0_13735 [Gemmataceae bacterium]
MPHSLLDVELACIHQTRLPLLARLRCHNQVTVTMVEESAWIRWTPGDETVLEQLLPVRDVGLFRKENGQWFPYNGYLPAKDIPESFDDTPLSHVLFPEKIAMVSPRSELPSPSSFRLIPSDKPRVGTGLLCQLEVLTEWSQTVSVLKLETLRAAIAGNDVFILGESLPAILSGDRFWGTRVLVPLGMRLHPELSEATVRSALSTNTDELVLFRENSCEAIPEVVFQPLSRASLSLVMRETRS